jgi:uncharacterized phage protein (TIGR02216 family)
LKAAGAGRPAPDAFPWERVMRLGLGVLRLSPDAFWRMTPRELSAAVGGLFPSRPGSLARTDFAKLMQRFPD